MFFLGLQTVFEDLKIDINNDVNNITHYGFKKDLY